MDTKRFHKLTCAQCRQRKEKCDGAHPSCSLCRLNRQPKCCYDKPASISYVRHLENQVSLMQKKLDEKLNESIAIPYEYISQAMKHPEMFQHLPSNHLQALLACIGEESDAAFLTDRQFDAIMDAQGLTTPSRMVSEVIRLGYMGFLPLKVTRRLQQGAEKELPFTTASTSPLIAEVAQMYIRVYGTFHPTGTLMPNPFNMEEDVAFRHKWVTLMSKGLFEPPTQALAFAFIMQSNLEVQFGGSLIRSWIFLGIAIKIVSGLSDYSPKVTRIYWVAYSWDKILATFMNRPPLLGEVPPALPNEMELSIFDVHSLSERGSPNKDATPLLIMFARLAIILRDLLLKTDRFLPVRNHLLGLLNELQLDSSPEVLEAEDSGIGYCSWCYYILGATRFRLLTLQFSSGIQAQLRTLNNDTSSTSPYSALVVNTDEFVELVQLIHRLWVPLSLSKDQTGGELFLSTRKYWAISFILMPLHALLSNMAFIEYTEQWPLTTGKDGHPLAGSVSVTLFVDFFRSLWEALASERRFMSPAVRDHVRYMEKNPLKVLEREDYALHKRVIETCFAMIKANQTVSPDTKSSTFTETGLSDTSERKSETAESASSESHSAPIDNLSEHLPVLSKGPQGLFSSTHQRFTSPPFNSELSLGYFPEPPSAPPPTHELVIPPGAPPHHSRAKFPSTEGRNDPTLPHLFLPPGPESNIDSHSGFAGTAIRFPTPHGTVPTGLPLYDNAFVANDDLFAPPLQLMRDDYTDRLSMETLYYNNAGGENYESLFADLYLNHSIDRSDFRLLHSLAMSPSWGPNPGPPYEGLFLTPPIENQRPYKRNKVGGPGSPPAPVRPPYRH